MLAPEAWLFGPMASRFVSAKGRHSEKMGHMVDSPKRIVGI